MRTGMDLGWVKWVIGLTMLGIFALVLIPNLFSGGFPSQPTAFPQEQVELQGEPIPQEEVDLYTWQQLGGQGLLTHYNVDVWIPTSHAWLRHGDEEVQAAIRSATQNGTQMVLSQKDNGNLHLLTKDDRGNEYVVVINRVTKSLDPYKNNTSALNTAWKLKDGATIGSYFQEQVVNGQRCILVRLKFDPGELFFTPHK